MKRNEESGDAESMREYSDPQWMPGLSDGDRLKAQAALNRIRRALSPEAQDRHKQAWAKATELVKNGVLDLQHFSQAFIEARGPYPTRHVKSYFMQAMQEAGHLDMSDEDLLEIIVGDD